VGENVGSVAWIIQDITKRIALKARMGLSAFYLTVKAVTWESGKWD
jgi:hypothetical protein